MELQYKEQMAQTAERWEAFWAGEVLDRPLVCVTAPKRGHEKTRRWHGIDYRRVVEAKTEADFQSMMEDFERFAGETAYLGESIPFCRWTMARTTTPPISARSCSARTR